MPAISNKMRHAARTFLILSVLSGPIAMLFTISGLFFVLFLQSLSGAHQSITGYDRLGLSVIFIMMLIGVLALSPVFGLGVDVVFCKVLIPFALLLSVLWLLFGRSRLLGMLVGILYFGTVGFFVDRYGADIISIIHEPQQQGLNSPNPMADILMGSVVGLAIGWMSFELSVGRLGRWLLKKVYIKKTPWDLSDVWRKYK